MEDKLLTGYLEYEGGDVQAKVFDAVVSMCSARIIERIGTGKGKMGKEQKSIGNVLSTVIKDLRHQSRPVQDVHHRVKTVITLIDAWSRHRVDRRLGAIVDGMHDLYNSDAWRPFIASIPSPQFQKSQIDRLEKAVRKLARYRDVSTYLYRTARKYPIARAVLVVPVDLPPALFERTLPIGYVAEVVPALDKIRGNTLALNDVCNALSIQTSEAESRFKNTASSALEKSGIHAEIQLLAYCSLELTGPRPRVICSSKKACFLCNLLINTHGKIYTPYSHGRLYTGWRLPKFRDTHLARRLDIALQDFSRGSLETLRRSKKKIKYPHPDESAVHTLVLSSDTLDEPASDQHDKGGASKDLGPVDEQEVCVLGTRSVTTDISASNTVISLETSGVRGGSGTSPPLSEYSGNPQSIHPSGGQYDTHCPGTPGVSHEPSTPHEIISQDADVSKVPVPATVSEECRPPPKFSPEPGMSSDRLSPGERKSKHLSVDHGDRKLFPTDTFHLLVDRDTSCASRGLAQRVVCDVALLTAQEANRVTNDGNSLVVDVESLDQVSLELKNCLICPFFISGGGCVLQVSLRDGGKVE